MKFFLLLILSSLLIAQEITVKNVSELEKIFSKNVDSITVYLEPGYYDLTKKEIIDSSCGNCESKDTLINATTGLIIRGNNVKIYGPENHEAILNTNAGYGIYILNSLNVELNGLVITGGARDSSGAATDAGIVVKKSRAVIKNNIIRDNIGDSTAVVKNIVGIMGICGREDAELVVTNNQIIRNSWDGIALYANAQADIKNNLIDGVDKATSKIAGGGRGVAIGVTWDATAEIENNLLRRYWKGIGIFLNADVGARNNIVEDMITWGIAYWDAGKGDPIGYITNNIIYSTGACGVSIARTSEGDETGELIRNVIVKTAQNPKYDSPDYYCSQCALAISAQPESFEIINNIFYNNRRASDDLPNYDENKNDFLKLFNKWKGEFSNNFFDESSVKQYLDNLAK